MKVYYCDFSTVVGTMRASFTKIGLVKLSLPTEEKKDTIDFLKRNFAEICYYEGEKEAYSKEVTEYLHGRREKFSFPLDLRGTDFQKIVWNELIKIPYGTVVSYGDIASIIGKPKAARAIGGANNKNQIPIVVPCHRVIGSDGDLVGYGGGIEYKVRLLELEGIKVEKRFKGKIKKYYVERYGQENRL